MHIPDGYLSPSTCAVAYAAAAPFWALALRRVERQLNTRMVPLMAVFSAFCLVIMMFNLPLPGGTTGHPVGMGIAAVVLGPWASLVAISIALVIQAVFFGDGGITTLGANCFNMAIVGSWVAYGVYRLVAGKSAITSTRRVVAAAVGGYTAINAAALLAAVEFGVQPMLFHTPSGAPLYAPYPLHIAIPAMMIGHLGLAGIAEALVSAGLVSWLQRTEPGLLRATAPGVAMAAPVAPDARTRGGWLGTRKLWAMLGVLMVLTPLGLLATGAAWGEWGTEAFSHAETRHQIAQASADQALPPGTPRGLARLSSLWHSPMPGYEPPFLRGPAGYALSALLGTGLVILLWLAAGRLLAKVRRRVTQP